MSDAPQKKEETDEPEKVQRTPEKPDPTKRFSGRGVEKQKKG